MRAAGTRTTGPATPPPSTEAALRQEVESLRTENRELRESLDAIRRGEVDALIVTEDGTPRVYSLEGVDHPYRALVERIQEGALTLTTEGIILFANAAFARMRDLPLSGVLGTPFSSHVAAPDREQFARVLADAQASSRRCELGICAGAGTVPAALSLTPIEAGGATTIGVVVTDRRRDYDRLRLQGRMLDAVVDAVTAADPDGTLIYWNGAAERLYGWTAAEMVGRPMASSTEPEVTGEEARRVLTILNAGQAWSGEHMARHRDGRCFPVQATKAPVFDEDGRLAAVIGTSQDISERKQAENALRESEGRLLLAQSAGGIGVYDWDLATGQVVWSPQLETVFGMATPADPRERHDAWFRCVHPEDRDRLQQEMRRWLESGRDRTAWKYRFVRADGEERWIEGQSLLVRDGEGRPARVIGTNTDITDWKRTEASLRSYAEHLRRSNEDLERFAYVASHDLQEPLRSIVSFSQLLDRRYKGKLGQDADEYIAFIVEGGTRMQRLILDLLAYSRVNTNPQELRPTDVEAVIAAVERQLTPSLSEAGAALTSDPLPVVTADPLQLEQVFANLVSNAVKFRRDDGPLRIHVGARRVDGFWEFSISDNGIGIEEEYFDRIFVIFKRLHTKDAYPGTGIGLAIVKRIIDRHGGTVRVESTPGEGSTFFFTLPAA